MSVNGSRHEQNFHVRCEAGEKGCFEVTTDTLSVVVGQRVVRGTEEEIWDSVLVGCHRETDGSLVVEVVICHPDWDEAVKIASIQARSKDGDISKPALECNFQHTQVR
jgi:hypothetical protein